FTGSMIVTRFAPPSEGDRSLRIPRKAFSKLHQPAFDVQTIPHHGGRCRSSLARRQPGVGRTGTRHAALLPADREPERALERRVRPRHLALAGNRTATRDPALWVQRDPASAGL